MRITAPLLVALAWSSSGLFFAACGGPVPTAEVPAPPSEIGDPDLSRLIAQRTASVRSSPTSAEAWGELALAYDAHDYLDRALAAYEEAADLDPKRFDWPYLHAAALSATDQVAALEWFDRAAALRDDYAPLFVLRGLGRYAVGELEPARADLERATKLDDSLVAAHMGLAKIALDQDRGEAAYEHAARAVELGPGSDEPYGVLALAQQRLGRDEEAAQSLAEVDDGGRREPVPDTVRDQLGRHGVTTDWVRQRADGALARGDVQAAVGLWESAAESKPGDVPAMIGLSLTLQGVGRNDEARAALEQARATLQGRGPEADPVEVASVAFGLGLDSLSRGDAEAAKKELDEALEADPNLAAARGYRGVAALMTDNRAEGLKLLRSAAQELEPEHAIQMNLAKALIEVEQWHEAREVLERYLAAGPSTGQLLFMHGRVLAGLGEFQLAAAAFERSAGQEPANMSAYSNRARALGKAGQHAEAAAAYRKMCDAFPSSARARQQRAWHLATTPDEAVVDGATALALAEELLAGQPDNAEILSLAAASAAAAGEFKKAQERGAKALERLEATTSVPGPALDRLRSKLVEQLEGYQAGRRWSEP